MAVIKQVVLDPTTYAPTLVDYGAARLDWRSSQLLFRHGFLEHNPEFTVSGLEDDVPISYRAGNRKLLAAAAVNLQFSLINNAAAAVIERVLIERYPTRRKLFRTLGWIERISFASYVSYIHSAGFLRQWRENERVARQLGYK